ncbi:MAG: CPBP family intramembrane glutamic endopeptidase [Bacteroidia bacterium]
MNTLAPLEKNSPASQFFILMGLFLVCLVVFSVLAIIAAMPFAHISGINDIGKLSNYGDPDVVMGLKMAQVVSAVGSFIVPAFLFSVLASRSKLEYLGLKIPPNFGAMLLVGIIMLAAMPFINWMADLNSRLVLPASLSGLEHWMKDSEAKAGALVQAFLNDKSIHGLFLNLFVIAFLAAVSEEIFFRGVLQKILIAWTKSTHSGIWIAAIVFSAFHFEFYGFVPRMMMGVFLGYIYVWSKSIWIPMFAHFVNNGMDVLLTFLEQRNKVPKNIDQLGTATNDWWQVVASVLLIGVGTFVFYKWMKKKEKPESIPLT